MTGLAIGARRDAVPHAVANEHAAGDAAFRREQRLALILVPGVRGVLPAFGRVLDEARFGALPECELLPEARADRKLPSVRIRGIDECAARQFHPSRLLCAVGPERILRGKQDLPGTNALGVPVGIQAGFFERWGGPGVYGPGEACKRTDEQDGSQNKLLHLLLVCSGGRRIPRLRWGSKATNPNQNRCRLIAWGEGVGDMRLATRMVIVMVGLSVSVAVAGRPLAGQAPTDAAPILTKAREALGGEKKLASIKTIVASGQTRQIRGENLIPIVFELNIELPAKYSRRDETPAVESGYTTSGFSSDDLIQLPAPTAPTMPPMAARPGGPPPPTPEQIAAQQAAQRKNRVATLKQDYARLMLGFFAASTDVFPVTFQRFGIAESPQGKADVITVCVPNNFTYILLINPLS